MGLFTEIPMESSLHTQLIVPLLKDMCNTSEMSLKQNIKKSRKDLGSVPRIYDEKPWQGAIYICNPSA